MDTINVKIQGEESSMAGVSRTGSTEGTEYEELRCSGTLEGATGRNSGSANLEGLTEKVDSLGLQRPKRN
jgi:hypothetical protein